MLKKIYRNRYRLILGAVVGMIALNLGFPYSPVLEALPRGERLMTSATVSFLATLIFLAATITICPRSPRLVEVVALPMLGFAIMVNMFPNLDPFRVSAVHGFVIFGLVTVLSSRLLYGRILDSVTLMDGPLMTGRMLIDAPRDHIWRCLIPAPGHENYFFYRDSQFIVEKGVDNTEWTAIVKDPDSVFCSLNRIVLHQIVPGEHFEFGFEPARNQSDMGQPRGTFKLDIAPGPDDSSWVDIEFFASDTPLRSWLNWLLSDRFNEQMALIKERCEERVTSTEARRKYFSAALHVAK